ncbi:MAG: hypothetical protein HQL56_11930 [Magnetococcales bacterium]|nr:hypothetical protein [Magnetococcales bacterium]
MNANSDVSETNWTDPDDAPDLTEEWLAKSDLYEGNRLIRTGPSSSNPGLDLDVFLALQARGSNWREEMNTALRQWLASCGAKLPV